MPRDSDSTIVETGDSASGEQSGPSPCFVVLKGLDLGRCYRLRPGVSEVGRTEDTEIRMRDVGVSRKHARVVWDGRQKVGVVDLGSTNGTFVNGEQIKGPKLTILGEGDRLGIGRRVELKFGLRDSLEAEVQHQLYDRAVRDPLTGAYNKRYLFERLDQEFAYARRHKTALALLVVDLDHFKAINDNFGHAAGDAVLREVAQILMGEVRREDLAARYGGEEFVIVLRETDAKGASILAERVRQRVEGHAVAVDGRNIQVTCSVGLAISKPGDTTIEEVFGRADSRLYDAKRAGRNQVVGLPPG